MVPLGAARFHGRVHVAAGRGEAGLELSRAGVREDAAEGVERVEG